MTDALDYRPVLRAYSAACQPQDIEFLEGAGGFSGARLWRITAPCGNLCLRRWPQEHSRERLEFIQAVLWHVSQEGFHKIPLPLETVAHHGYVRHAGHLWEVTPWLPGGPDRDHPPRAARVRAALAAVAEFHRAAASFPLPEAVSCPSPGIAQRQEQLASLEDRGLDRLRSALAQSITPYQQAATRMLELVPPRIAKTRGLLEQAAQVEVALQPCLRDIWRDNVLFEEDAVTGLIDFGALRPESVAADVARLLGSLAEDDRSAWRAGFTAYEEVRPLSEVEVMLVTAFDESGVLLGAINWLVWLYDERRVFDRPAAVAARLEYFCRRLGHLA